MGEREPRPTRADYVAWSSATTRWSDEDVYGHVNNAAYFELIDTCVNAHLIEATGLDVRRMTAIGVVAEVSCRYFSELGFPKPVEMGLVVERVGASSIVYRVGLFQGFDDPAAHDPVNAEGRLVHVYVGNAPGADQLTRPVIGIPPEVRLAATALRRG